MSDTKNKFKLMLDKVNAKSSEIIASENIALIDIHLLQDYIKQLYEASAGLNITGRNSLNEAVFEIKPSHAADKIKEQPLHEITTEPQQKEIQAIPEKKEITGSQYENYSSVGQKFAGQESIHDKITGSHYQTAIADKLKEEPLHSLVDAIGVNERFAFANVFMNGDINMFYTVLTQLNSKSGFDEAWNFFKENIVEKFNVDKNHKAYREFVDLLKRRFVK